MCGNVRYAVEGEPVMRVSTYRFVNKPANAN